MATDKPQTKTIDLDTIRLVERCQFIPEVEDFRCATCREILISNTDITLLYCFRDCSFIVDRTIKEHIREKHNDHLTLQPYDEKKLTFDFIQDNSLTQNRGATSVLELLNITYR